VAVPVALVDMRMVPRAAQVLSGMLMVELGVAKMLQEVVVAALRTYQVAQTVTWMAAVGMLLKDLGLQVAKAGSKVGLVPIHQVVALLAVVAAAAVVVVTKVLAQAARVGQVPVVGAVHLLLGQTFAV